MSTLPSQTTLNNDGDLTQVYGVIEEISNVINQLFELLPSLERIHKTALDANAQSKAHRDLEKRNSNAARLIAKVKYDISQLDQYIAEFRNFPSQQRVVKTQQQELRQQFLTSFRSTRKWSLNLGNNIRNALNAS